MKPYQFIVPLGILAFSGYADTTFSDIGRGKDYQTEKHDKTEAKPYSKGDYDSQEFKKQKQERIKDEFYNDDDLTFKNENTEWESK